MYRTTPLYVHHESVGLLPLSRLWVAALAAPPMGLGAGTLSPAWTLPLPLLPGCAAGCPGR